MALRIAEYHQTRLPLGLVVCESEPRSEEHTSELQSLRHLVCRLLLEKKNAHTDTNNVGLLTYDIVDYERRWCTRERSTAGFFVSKDNAEERITLDSSYARYADMCCI